MNMKHIQIPETHRFDPMLMEFVTKVSMDRPNWVFKVPFTPTERNLNSNTNGHALRPRDRTETSAGPAQYLRSLAVYQDGQRLGVVKVEQGHWGRFRGEYFFSVNSWRIKKERGNMNETRTTKLESAVREAKKNFAAQSYREFWDETTHLISVGFGKAISMLSHAMVQQINKADLGDIALFVHDVVLGQPSADGLAQRVRDVVQVPEFAQIRANYELGRHMYEHRVNRAMSFVISHDGCFLFAEGSSDDFAACAFEQLPDAVQNRVAVLQLVDDNELVLDTGYRHKEGWYYVYTN